ncbi:gluconate 2-dehydrogenase subunit 3 family protein [Cupriavidus pauculus]|uniref:gluconate 2-dehydrogenase subunit 3 family protein n=1 Tax=Cupriavidus pauculus TaxID=82633 RepID=UPI001FD21BF8|nr:gluconate 2-dehydrogenase subunit 3 family protein [Cupriavidus pauculus]
MQDPFRPSRRRLLKAIGATVPASAAVLAAAQGPTPSAASPHGTAPAAQPASAPQGAALQNPVALFFNADERITVDAIVARLIPADELGPGAKEAGVTTFLDRQLGGAYGAGAHFYRQGPFQPGTPEQGYQLPLTPAECYRLGLAALDRACETQYGGKRFAQLDAATQDTVLSALESGKLALDPLPGPVFFQMLLDGAIEGFFSDPVYGGNRDMVGWKLVGFPGAMASFANDIERHNVAYVRAPVSIATARPHAMEMPSPSKHAQGASLIASADDAICRSPAAPTMPLTKDIQ